MSSNETFQTRSMNGIIDVYGENITANNIDAESIDVEFIKIENNLSVSNTNISPLELSYLNLSTSNIQNQLDNINTNISDNLLTTNTEQTIIADKTIEANLKVNNINFNPSLTSILPEELSVLKGIDTTQTLQNQLQNAGISNVCTINTDQIITGKKTFTQPVGLPSVEYGNQTGTQNGYMTNNSQFIFSAQTGTFSVNNSVIQGEGINSTIASYIQNPQGTEVFNFNTAGTAPAPIKNVDGYLQDGTSYILYNVNNIISPPINQHYQGIQFNSIPPSITPYENDFIRTLNGYRIEMVENISLPVITFYTTGYVANSNTFISNDNLEIGGFLEGSGLTAPVQITSRNGVEYTIQSPNTINTATPINIINGVVYESNRIFYNSSSINPSINNFVSNNNFGASIDGVNTNINQINILNNTYIQPRDYEKIGYVYDETTLIIDNTDNLQINQFVFETNITNGNNFITDITNNQITLSNATITLPPINLYDGYLINSNTIVSNGNFIVGNFVKNVNIPTLTTKVLQLNSPSQLINLNTNNNIPTPNNKTYNGFSINSTEFYYNNDNTNVAIDYYLKDNDIITPTTNHLISSVDTTNKKLTTINLPISNISSTKFGYVNTNLNKIIINSTDGISLNDGIISNMNSGIRFISSINNIEIDVFGSLITIPPVSENFGFCTIQNESLVYDVNNNLQIGNFLVDYQEQDIPNNCLINSIQDLGFDMYKVGLNSSGTFIPSPLTLENNCYRPQVSQIALNSQTLTNNIYSKSETSNYRFISSQTTDPYVYNTNDTTGNDFVISQPINPIIATQTGQNYWLILDLDPKIINQLGSYFNKYIQQDDYAPTQNFCKTDTSINENYNESILITQIVNLPDFQPLNYGTRSTNLNIVNVESSKYVLNYFGIYILIGGGGSLNFYPNTYDVVIDITGIDTYNNIKANESNHSGLYLKQNLDGNALQLNNNNIPTSTPFMSGLAIVKTTELVGNHNRTPSNKLLFTDIAGAQQSIVQRQGNNFIQSSFIVSVQPRVIIGITYYEYTLSPPVIPDSNYRSWSVVKSIAQIRNQYGNNFVFDSLILRPPSNLISNFYNTNFSVYIPDNQTTYSNYTQENIDIYSDLNSYNSYEKITFEEIPPISFDIYNTQTIDEYSSIGYNLFEKINFNIYNSLQYIANTTIEVGFDDQLLNNDTFVLEDAIQTLTNKTIGDDLIVNGGATISGNANISGNADISGNANINGLEVGQMTSSFFTDWKGIARTDLNETYGYTLMTNSVGTTIVNAATGGELQLRINNTNKVQVRGTEVYFPVSIKSPAQPMWYFTGGNGNQNYGAGGRIGSKDYTGGYPSSFWFNSRSAWNASNNDFNFNNGAFYATSGEGIYMFNLYIFCNNATSFSGRISLQTDSGRIQSGQYNMDVNRNTSAENCALLSWTIYMNFNNYAFFNVHSSLLTCYIASLHTGLRVIKLM